MFWVFTTVNVFFNLWAICKKALSWRKPAGNVNFHWCAYQTIFTVLVIVNVLVIQNYTKGGCRAFKENHIVLKFVSVSLIYLSGQQAKNIICLLQFQHSPMILSANYLNFILEKVVCLAIQVALRVIFLFLVINNPGWIVT